MTPTRGRLVAVATHNVMILAVLMFLRFRQRNRRTRIRSEYARHILRNRHISCILGEFHQLTPEQRIYDHHFHFESYRINPTRLEQLLNMVGGRLVHYNTHMHPVGPAERLAVTVKQGFYYYYFIFILMNIG